MKGCCRKPDRTVEVRPDTHGERRPDRLGGLPQQRLATEEGMGGAGEELGGEGRDHLTMKEGNGEGIPVDSAYHIIIL